MCVCVCRVLWFLFVVYRATCLWYSAGTRGIETEEKRIVEFITAASTSEQYTQASTRFRNNAWNVALMWYNYNILTLLLTAHTQLNFLSPPPPPPF